MIDKLGEAERVAVLYAPRRLRTRYLALFALDGTLRRIAVTGSEPLYRQLKLAWWRDALARLPLDGGNPVLAAVAKSWPGDRATLAGLVDGWEEYAVGEGGTLVGAEAVAQARGAAFAACAEVSAGEPALAAARIWTVVEVAGAVGETVTAVDGMPPLPRSLRPLAVLAGLAKRAAAAQRGPLLGDRFSPLAAIRLGILGR